MSDQQKGATVQTEITIKLQRPVQVGAVTYEELSLTEPTLGELRKASKAGDSMDQLAALIVLNAKVPATAVDQLCQRDMSACADFFGSFGNGSP